MLSDPRSAEVKELLRLKRKDARSESGLFLLEGPQALKEALARLRLLNEVYATAAAWQRFPELLGQLTAAEVRVTECSEAVMERLADTETPQGIVAVCRQFHTPLDKLLARPGRLICVLDQVRDPGNAGTVLRAADAAGADAVIFTTESVELYNSKLVRATTGSIFHLPIAIEQHPDELFPALSKAGYALLATSADGTEITPDNPLLAEPTAWIFGNEANGLSPETLRRADELIALPIFGEAESLNLATAASVCLYLSAFAQRQGLENASNR